METSANIKNGDTENPEKILVYLGPSLPLIQAKSMLPFAVYKPPCKQGDIVSDLVNENPSRIILIDGCFSQNLSPWHKEIVYALQYPGVKAVYGASSMGALRAAELDYLGMIGIGRIYEFYRDGVTEDDAEVALTYNEIITKGGLTQYFAKTVPLVDIRAGVEHYEREFPDQPVAVQAREFLCTAREVSYMDRTPARCQKIWGEAFGVSFPHLPQKSIDASRALGSYADYQPSAMRSPTPEDLSRFFHALYERDRKIKVDGRAIPQQHLDAYVLLHNPEYERICWDASNQELALMLCDILCVTVDLSEIERENQRFQQRSEIATREDFRLFLEKNGWSPHEYDRLMIANARIRKLQHAHTVTKMYRRNTQSIIDYLRTHQGFDYWAVQAVQLEEKIKQSGVDDWLGVNLETPTLSLLAQYLEKEGLEFTCNIEEYLLETGFSNLTELGVALSRVMAGKEL
jgi:hypothetical protein